MTMAKDLGIFVLSMALLLRRGLFAKLMLAWHATSAVRVGQVGFEPQESLKRSRFAIYKIMDLSDTRTQL